MTLSTLLLFSPLETLEKTSNQLLLFSAAAVAALAVGTIFSKGLPQYYDHLHLFFYQLLIGILLLLPVIYFEDYTLSIFNIAAAAGIGALLASYPLFRCYMRIDLARSQNYTNNTN